MAGVTGVGVTGAGAVVGAGVNTTGAGNDWTAGCTQPAVDSKESRRQGMQRRHWIIGTS
jgi:hypothetical protein